MVGNGGYAGEDLENPGRVRIRNAAVGSGFVHTQTNTGHDAAGEPLGAFATSPQKLVDYAFRAVHVTAVTAKKIATAYYGVAPRRSYFVGCSTGGRQGLIAAQRFPEDFDGIYSGAPVLDFVGTMVDYVTRLQATVQAPYRSEKLKLAGQVIYAKCDEKDGVKDGLIEDPRRCLFDPGADLPRCANGDAPDCFTQGDIAGLQLLYSDRTVNGRRVFPRWPVGIEVPGVNGRIGWEPWLVRENAPPISAVFSEAFFRYLALPTKNPELRLDQIDLAAIYPQLGPIQQTLNATDPDLSAFRDRGGKLLMWFGWADPALNPNMGVEYYESVLERMGPKTTEFFRLFMMPGVFHCAGGPGCDGAPRLAALIDWVERGKAPEQITASRTVAGRVTRTRPLCLFPKVAKYKGSGSTDDAANFVCAEAN
jgi:feruloyl esterase